MKQVKEVYSEFRKKYESELLFRVGVKFLITAYGCNIPIMCAVDVERLNSNYRRIYYTIQAVTNLNLIGRIALIAMDSLIWVLYFITFVIIPVMIEITDKELDDLDKELDDEDEES